MKKVVIIPARLKSTRLERKMLRKLGEYSIIQHVYRAAIKMKSIDAVYVATDSEEIYDNIRLIDGIAIMTSVKHSSGTDRIAEVARKLNLDENSLVINLQGDEPFINISELDKFVNWIEQNFEENIVYTIGTYFKNMDEIDDPSYVKIVLTRTNYALYFSRSKIPYDRERTNSHKYIRHVGIYAMSNYLLQKFTDLAQSKLEKMEKLEQLRFLENGYRIKVFVTEQDMGIGIDTESDYEKAKLLIEGG